MNILSKTAKQLQRHYASLISGDIHPVCHPTAKGDAREHGWRELFRRFLPEKYGVKSGFVINSSDEMSKQVDCIIYHGEQVLLNQLIRLAEGIAILESARCLQSCCLTKYKALLDKPQKIKI